MLIKTSDYCKTQEDLDFIQNEDKNVYVYKNTKVEV